MSTPRTGRFILEKEPRYELNWRLGGPQEQVWTCQRKEKLIVAAGIRTPDRPVRRLITIPAP